jgi:hypothetical protein
VEAVLTGGLMVLGKILDAIVGMLDVRVHVKAHQSLQIEK